MRIKNIIESKDPASDLSIILEKLHVNGGDGPEILEKLSYFKEFHPIAFKVFEEKIISSIGVFYKIKSPQSLYSFLMSGFGTQHKEQYGATLTPVQASIRRAVDSYQYTSISAPTSAGKSYSIRDLIANTEGDAVIVVPSRALIAEYLNTMKRKFVGDKNVMITSFVDDVYKSRKPRRIFILTPERSKDLYRIKDALNIKIFFFDEAQISEELDRGIIFDVMIRRIQKHFPRAKLIFAHPFVENPDAQFSKHNIAQKAGFSKSYTHGSVGKICAFTHRNQKSYYFSPYALDGHQIKNCVELTGSFKDHALNGTHSILVYVSKASIYRGDFTEEFDNYIDKLPEIVNQQGLAIIDRIEHILGTNSTEHRSKMIDLFKKGVVIHHGSIPLEVRFLIENFIRDGHAKLCFATSTLAQGINMPFDIVWLNNNRFNGGENEAALAFKNLIGRSGRLSEEEKFDYGYVYTSDPKLFSVRIRKVFELRPTSLIETYTQDSEGDSDRHELISSIQNNTFDDEKNIPLSKVERLSKQETLDRAAEFLNIVYGDGNEIKANIGGSTNYEKRTSASNCLKHIYQSSLGRSLEAGEEAIFSTAVSIFFHMIQGRSFREIVGLRYTYISNRRGKNGAHAKFSQPAYKLPDKTIQKTFSLFESETPAMEVGYDAIVFDTYDYMDTVISFSLSDVFIAAFSIYREKKADDRADKIIELFRYGTNNEKHILLMRYGFSPEVIGEIALYVDKIDEFSITFKSNITDAPPAIMEIIDWYLPGN